MFDFDKRLLKNIDWIVIVAYLALSIISLFAIAATTGDGDVFFTGSLKRQIVWIIISIVAFIVILGLDYRVFYEFSYIIYAFGIILLLIVAFAGVGSYGARRWLNIFGLSIQPSEFVKIMTFMALARFISNRKDSVNHPLTLLMYGAIFAVPTVGIMLQPDLGTALVIVFSALIIIFVAGISWKYIIAALSGLILSSPIIWTFLSEYQKKRILVFLNPEMDPLGAAYSVLQARTAIGAGNYRYLAETGEYIFELGGKGMFAPDTMTGLNFIPKQYTDFIFSAIGEGWGIIGASAVVILMLLIVYRLFLIAAKAKDLYGAFLVSGIAGMFLFHTWVNIGMNMGLMPVTGLPLPFVSLGGSSFLANSIGLGIAINIGMRYQKIQF